ncbi:MAG: Yip1 family protein [Candidatus Bathycorpusculaceae bacterium]
MFAYGIFKVIYAPHKAFKEIIQDPKYIGPILIMILFIAADMGFAYTLLSKQYIEQTLPTAEQTDIWTENSTLWTSNGEPPKNNYDDFINGTYYGNRSIEFSILNNKQIWMQLNDMGTINCSGQEGYKSLYLRIKLTSTEDKPLQNVTIFLFSSTLSDYFYYDLTENLSSTFDVWNNLTIPLGGKWLNNSAAASWANITGLKLDFTWLENSTITLLIDGLFFGGVFKSSLTNVVGDMLSFSLSAFTQFVIRWIILGGLLYIMIKAFGAKILWRPVLILIGFTLITMFIQAVINAATFSTLPTLYYRFDLIGGVKGESEAALTKLLDDIWLVNQIYGYVQIAVHLWTMGLCAIATHLLTQFSWTKSFFIGAFSYFASLMLTKIMLGI